LTALEIGKAEIVAEYHAEYDEQISILAFGSRVTAAIEAAVNFANCMILVYVSSICAL
jgi:1-deoxy-D-xylulose-5-phosphate synthase